MGKGAAALVLVVPLLLGAGTLAATALGQSPEPTIERDPFYEARSRGVQELAAALNSRERQLDARERTLEDRERDLREAEVRLEERLGDLDQLRTDMDDMLVQLEEEQEARVRALVRMVESVRPAQAAPIVSQLDEALAVDVLVRMNRSKAGKLLAAMSPAQAARLAQLSTAPLEIRP